jgi:hypothetical protein
MSRLDDHVSAVRNRLALRLFVVALGWSSAIYALLVLLAVLADRVFLLRLPQPMLWLYSGAAAAVVAALGYALHKRPDEHEAARSWDSRRRSAPPSTSAPTRTRLRRRPCATLKRPRGSSS